MTDKRYSPKAKQEWVTKWKLSGKSIPAFCQDNKDAPNPGSLYRWTAAKSVDKKTPSSPTKGIMCTFRKGDTSLTLEVPAGQLKHILQQMGF